MAEKRGAYSGSHKGKPSPHDRKRKVRVPCPLCLDSHGKPTGMRGNRKCTLCKGAKEVDSYE